MKPFIIVLLLLLSSCTVDRTEQKRELVSRLRSSSDLATVEIVFSKVVRGSKTSTFFGIPTGYSDFLAETEARAKAGIDLSKIEVPLIEWETGTITLILPPPHIISIDIPAESFRVNEEYTKDNYLSSLESKDMDAFYQQAEREVRAEVKRMNLEATAREKTEKFLQEFLSKAGFSEINFQYAESASDS